MMLNSTRSSSAIAPLVLPLESFKKLLMRESERHPQPALLAMLSQSEASGHSAPLILCSDTRAVPANSSYIFFGKAGKNFDPWHDMVTLAERAEHSGKLSFCIVEASHKTLERLGGLSPAAGMRIFALPQFERFLSEAAALCLHPGTKLLKTFGITGTNGKTSTTSLLAQLLEAATEAPVARLGTLGFFDGHMEFDQPFPTTPDFVTFCRYLNHLVKVGTKTLVMEASSHGLAEGRLHDWQFDGAALTNLTPDHLDFHQTMEQYWAAKKLLFSKHLKPTGVAIIAAEKSPWSDVVPMLCERGHGTILAVKTSNPDLKKNVLGVLQPDQANHPTLKIVGYDSEPTGIEGLFINLHEDLHGRSAATKFQAPMLFGDFQAENLAVALSLLHALGYPWSAFEPHTTSLKPIPGRMEMVTPPGERERLPIVFVDYAHTPDALESSLRSLRALAAASNANILTVFGCGGDRDRSKRPLMGEIAARLSHSAIITSDNPRNEDLKTIINDILAGFPPSAEPVVEQDRAAAIQLAITQAGPGDLILIAGKGHEDYQIIGSSKQPFSDAAIARKILQSWRLK